MGPAQPKAAVTIRLLKDAEVSGTVRFPDGKPAGGITILGEGRGPTNMYFRGSATTDADGHYRLGIYPRQSTIVAVADRDWAAASHTDVQLNEGKTREHLDFVLSRGTRIHGRVTVGPERKPASAEIVNLVELGEPLGEDARKFGHNEGNLVRWSQVDDKGIYEFRVGPGRFTLHLPNMNSQTKPNDINVTGQPELVYDVNAPRPDQLRVSGRIVNAADGKKVAGAIINGEPIGATGYAGIEAHADGQGQFSMVRMSDTEKYGYYVRAPESDLAAVAIVPSSSSDLTFALHPAASVVGFVYDTQGKPVVGEKVTAILGCSDEGCTGINANAVTDKSGRYRIPALAIGSRCSICLSREHVSVASIDVTLNRPGEISARDIVLPAKGAAAAPEAGLLHTVQPPVATSGTRKTPAADLTFTGTIRDEATGKPIPDATVVVRRMILNPSPGKHSEILEETRHTTDAAGHFTFMIRKEHVSNRRTYIELDATHPRFVAETRNGYSLNMILKNMDMGERPFFEDFRLTPGKTLTGVVAAPGGAPLADVVIQSYYYFTDPNQFGGFHETQTGKSGRFRMTVPAAGGAALWFLPKQYAPLEVVSEPQQSDLGVLTMKKGLVLSGMVLHVDGKPVGGQWVHVHRIEDRAYRSSRLAGVATSLDRYARSDAGGKVTFDPLPPGDYLVEPSQGGRWRQGSDNPTAPIQGVYYALKAKIEADAARPFVLKAVPTVKVIAQYYSNDGKKTSGGYLSCYGRTPGIEHEYWQTAFSEGRDGRYEMLAPRGMQVAALSLMTNEHSSLRFRKSADAPLQSGRQLNLGTLTGDVTDIRIIRYVSPVLLVKVRDRTGKPIKSADASARYDDTSLHESLYFEKQSDGRYRSSSLLPDEKFTVTVTADGYRPQSRSLSLAEGTTSELDLVLSPR